MSDRESGLNRRDFLSGTLALGASAAVAHALSLNASSATESQGEARQPFPFDEWTVAQFQEALKSGQATAVSLTETYLQRISEMDKQGPAVNSVLELNPDAVAIATELDRELKSKGARGPLHGIPVLIKDNIDTGDRMMTTAGSLALVGSSASRDAFIVKRLRDAGAVIIGKTNLSEWANIRSSHSSSGWSGRGGQTRNPYALDRNPCGSSSGSGAAVAANFCAVAVGTETDGSIVCPASANGIVGIKPTVGAVSRSGIIPISHTQDTAGPMTRTVADAAVLLGVLAGEDPSDDVTSQSRGKIFPDYTRFLERGGLKGARIGVLRKLFGFSDAVDQLMESALQAMKHEGAELLDPVEIASIGKLDDSENEVLLYEFKADLNAYLQKRGPAAPVHSLSEIIEFNKRNQDRELKYFGQDTFIKAQAKGPLTEKTYLDALARDKKLSRAEGIDAVMDKHKLDALVAPTGGPAWLTDLATGDHFSGGSSQLPAIAGYPNINVPAGFSFGLPVGISFFGRAYSEPTLIKIAYAFEQATRSRKAPRFLRSIEL